jgi:signal transduction histidine kinase
VIRPFTYHELPRAMFDQSRNPSILLSATRASTDQRRLALTVSALMLFMLVATAPFARVPWINLPVFVPIQKTLMLVADLITAVLLFGQYSIHPTRGLKIVAAGYLFTALITIPHTLAFPGVFSHTGLLAAGSTQSAAWLYIAWHGGLPLATIIFAFTRNAQTVEFDSVDKVRASICVAVLSAIFVVLAVTLLVTVGQGLLPPLVEGGRFTAASRAVVAVLLLLPLCGLLMLIRERSLLDLWLMVVMFAWLCTTTVGAFLSSGRFDVGWYVGLLFDSLTSVVVLLVLLNEILAIYARQFRAAEVERRERERRLNEMETVLVHLSRVQEIGQNASTLIHELGQPLVSISMLAQAGLTQREATVERLKQSLSTVASVSADAMTILERLRGFIKTNPPERRTQSVPEIIEDAIRLASLGGASNLVVDTQYHPAATLAFCDRVQIQQVVFNLVRNAIEAMAGGKRVDLKITTDPTSEGLIQVSIADSGPGLPAAVRAKLFEPFVSTKASGLGVGLSICRIIIEAHGGCLLADDNPGGGTIFYFTLLQGAVEAVAA